MDNKDKTIIRVGLGTYGISAGANDVYDAFKEAIAGTNLTLEYTSCNGMCFREPIVDIILKDRIISLSNVSCGEVPRLINEILNNKIIDSEDNDFLVMQNRIVLENCGHINPDKIDDYLAKEGYQALKKILLDILPEQVISEVKSSGLRGRGGAGFPTGLKWELARNSKSNEKYVICNADEGDPGAFMDRAVIEGDPHRVLEGLAISGYAIGAKYGYVYVRAEYPLAVKRIKQAIEDAQNRNLLGNNILGLGFNFFIKVKEGAGAFVCGEETALIASIEGKRGMPTLKPPYPAESGLWGYPTNINNVETLAAIPWIIRHGADKYANFGAEKSKGTKVFSLAGQISKGGLVEVEIGMSLRKIIYEIGAGTSSGKPVKAVQLGGPSGGCLPESMLDTPVDYESLLAKGAIMGSGGIVVMDVDTCMVDIARYFLAFTQKESCGKCTFCRLGTKRMLEILERITLGEGRESDVESLIDLASKIGASSLCQLGKTAPNPVLSTLKYFKDEYIEQIVNKKCRARSCKGLINYKITNKCIGCHLCTKACPAKAINGEIKEKHQIIPDLCIKCGICESVCKFEAIYHE